MSRVQRIVVVTSGAATTTTATTCDAHCATASGADELSKEARPAEHELLEQVEVEGGVSVSRLHVQFGAVVDEALEEEAHERHAVREAHVIEEDADGGGAVGAEAAHMVQAPQRPLALERVRGEERRDVRLQLVVGAQRALTLDRVLVDVERVARARQPHVAERLHVVHILCETFEFVAAAAAAAAAAVGVGIGIRCVGATAIRWWWSWLEDARLEQLAQLADGQVAVDEEEARSCGAMAAIDSSSFAGDASCCCCCRCGLWRVLGVALLFGGRGSFHRLLLLLLLFGIVVLSVVVVAVDVGVAEPEELNGREELGRRHLLLA